MFKLQSLGLALLLSLPASAAELVSLRQINPRIVQDLPYATAQNFTKAVVYDFKSCYLVPEVAAALNRVQLAAEKKGYGLKVWDCYRPMAAQKRFWELVPDPRYVSPPGKGGRHTRGTAVDLTMVDKQGKEVRMPTAFDDFSERAHRQAKGTPALAAQNSRRLESLMQAEGFIGLTTEWWHFDSKNWEQHAPQEVNIRQLESLKRD
jgi:D-alanyl-D-alanine dipeptidase